MFIDSPTEQTTAVTDLILALQAMVAIFVLRNAPARRLLWTDIWTWTFALLSVAGLLGAVSHGIQLTPSIDAGIWLFVYLALGILMALFSIAAVTMHWDHRLGRRCLPFGLIIAFVFFSITQFWSDSFLLFVVYEGIAMLFALLLYSSCFWLRREQGSGFLVSGILVGIVAAVIDTQSSLRLTFIWTFDNHGLFHIVQMLSLLLLTIGVHSSHQPATELASDSSSRSIEESSTAQLVESRSLQ